MDRIEFFKETRAYEEKYHAIVSIWTPFDVQELADPEDRITEKDAEKIMDTLRECYVEPNADTILYAIADFIAEREKK